MLQIRSDSFIYLINIFEKKLWTHVEFNHRKAFQRTVTNSCSPLCYIIFRKHSLELKDFFSIVLKKVDVLNASFRGSEKFRVSLAVFFILYQRVNQAHIDPASCLVSFFNNGRL